jgi:hypothetical protein
MNKEQSSSFDDNSNNSEKKKKKRRKLIIIILIIVIPIVATLAIVLGVTLNKSSNKKRTNTNSTTNSYSLYPSHIDGIAGEKYYISLEKNEQNNCVDPESITFLNSYGLNKSQLIINVEQNKKAQCYYNISVIQYNKTKTNEDNILTIKYDDKQINKSISLNITNAGFDKLEYISGPTQGNVLDPPNITFIPLDKYENIYSDIFKNNSTKKNFFDKLTKGTLGDKDLENNVYLDDEKYIKIQYKSTKTGNITMTSPYFNGKFEYMIKSGPIDLNNSYVEINDVFDLNLKYAIYLKDVYNNNVDDLSLNFLPHLTNSQEKNYINHNNVKCALKNNRFECELALSKGEDINNLKFFYDQNILRCINCEIKKTDNTPTTIIYPDIDENNFEVYYDNFSDQYTDQTIPAGENITFIVQAYDKNKNKINHISLSSELFKIEIISEISDYFLNLDSSNPGILKCNFYTEKIGSFKFNYYYNNALITINNNKGPDNIIYVQGACDKDNSEIIHQKGENIIMTESSMVIKCFDKYKNVIQKGGEKITANIKVDSTDELESNINDNGDGSYNLTYNKSLFGLYSIVILLDEKKFYETTLNLTDMQCQDKFEKCPFGNKICYGPYEEIDLLGRFNFHRQDCIPSENKCDDPETPEFEKKCKNTNKCVSSWIQCEPEEGYRKCEYMNFQYPIDKDYLCFKKTEISCDTGKVLCDDGICRSKKDLQPSQIVCPFGKILCPDLTCRDNINQCYTNYPECDTKQVRCPDQSCVANIENCPTTISCSLFDAKVCPDGTCVMDELDCPSLKTCPESEPFLCADYSCAKDAVSCTHFPSCGTGKTFCFNTRKCSEACSEEETSYGDVKS